MRASSFPPIESYGFLSDCETTALVAPSGNVEWLCLPRLDSPSVFGAILDRDAGGFRVGPADTMVPAARRYLPGTMVLETSWGTPTGWLIVCDVLLMGPWHHDTDRSCTHRRAPTDYDAEHVLLRMVRCVSGEVQLNLDCEPIFCYGRLPGRWEYPGMDYHEGLCRAEGSDIELRLTTDLRIGFEASRAVGRTLLKDGDRRFCALSWTAREPPRDWDEAEGRLIWTAHHWQHWLARGNFPDHPFRAHLERSALTLKGLSYAPTGALAAAATTSLPETPGGERNFDYRYSWIRDSSFTLWALNTLGLTWEADDYRRFIIEIASRYIDLQVMYGVGGERDLTEHLLEHLHGYEGARPVRVGNDAFHHHQHDVWGTMVDSVYLHTKTRDWLEDRLWQVLVHQVESAAMHWREPDRGIWEVRGEPRHFTSSKVMCWVALDRGARLARLREDRVRAEQWQQCADEVHADILANGVDEHGIFKQAYDTDTLDASLLLVPLVRFLPPDDPRVRATVLAIAAELTVDDLVLRYRTETTDDGFTGKEGAFAVCSFWLVSALVEIGEAERGRRLCGKLLSFAGPLGLYAEQIEPESGRHLGNFPQALTHLSLINAVFHVIRSDEA
ncbi:glycoside hydrolase family 15 protein [Dactylosporangium sp. CA-139114]|uniref:glycoside hydrolase family 15 protein n=1 Tax=Dactylosporangium sp. CA-139114 TaxID=3239931 RepID=UPI003D975CD9